MQVFGKVIAANIIEAKRITGAGNEFDMENYNKFIEISKQYAHLF